ncbi:MAG: TolC family protein [Gemmataceae bacterium]|nr:TolC family protein [Gemmataceae bacterium]
MPRATVAAAVAVLGLAGCATPPPAPPYRPPPLPSPARPDIVPASFAELPPPRELPTPDKPSDADPAARPKVDLSDLLRLAVARNPRLGQAAWAAEAARGRALQAGLYPNPVVTITGDELGDRTGTTGIWSAPYVTQEVVTANKLGLFRAVAGKEADQAVLAVVAERYQVFTDVRQAYWEVVTLRRRADILAGLVDLAERSVATVEKLRKAEETARLDVVQLEVDRERYRAELDATRQALPAANRRLAAAVAAPDLPDPDLAGRLDGPLPDYDLDRTRAFVLEVDPEVQSARTGVERARFALARAEAEPVPNVTLGAGYVRQNQNRSNDYVLSAGVPVPVWNQNQGNIRAAKAQLAEATAAVDRVRYDLAGRVAVAFGVYAAARTRAERYQAAIIPRAEEAYKLALAGRAGGQFEYLRVLQAQRAVAEAELEYVRSLGEAWRAASDLAGLVLEDVTPAQR